MKLSSREKRRLADLVQQGKPHVYIGKRGLCSEVIDEVDRQLDEREVIKVRFLKSALQVENCDRWMLARRLADAVNAEVLDVRGLTVILFRKRRLYKN